MPPLIVILGPTASGKTALGIELAKKIGGAVVSADSRQVYAGLNIGTAKPREAFRNTPHDAVQPDVIDSVPHYLLNIVSPATTYPYPPARRTRRLGGHPTPYSLAQWQQHAYQAIDQVIEKGQQPILVGGTMLYLDSVIYNYSLPQVPPNESLRQELEQHDVADLYKELITKDPAAADFIEPHHKRRIIRALEVIAATGQPFSHLRHKQPPRYSLKVFGLFPGWDILQKNIAQRAKQMIPDGLIKETRILREKYSPALPLLKTMNYLQACQIIDGNISQAEAVSEMIRVNKRYAHRQMSWWKNQKEITWLERTDILKIKKAIT